MELPREAASVWGTELTAGDDAAVRAAELMAGVGMSRCLVIEAGFSEGVGANYRVGLRRQDEEHVAVLSRVFAGWYAVDRVTPAVREVSPASPLADFEAGRTILCAREPDAPAIVGFAKAQKLHDLNRRFGKPSTAPERPLLLCLYDNASGMATMNNIVRAAALYDGVALVQRNASGIIFTTWSPRGTVEESADRWREAAGNAERVAFVDDLPVD